MTGMIAHVPRGRVAGGPALYVRMGMVASRNSKARQFQGNSKAARSPKPLRCILRARRRRHVRAPRCPLATHSRPRQHTTCTSHACSDQVPAHRISRYSASITRGPRRPPSPVPLSPPPPSSRPAGPACSSTSTVRPSDVCTYVGVGACREAPGTMREGRRRAAGSRRMCRTLLSPAHAREGVRDAARGS